MTESIRSLLTFGALWVTTGIGCIIWVTAKSKIRKGIGYTITGITTLALTIMIAGMI